MTTQGHAHVVHFHGDGVAPEQALVQQFDPRALDETEFQKPALQLHLVGLMVTVAADFDDDAAVAASGLAQLYYVGQIYAR